MSGSYRTARRLSINCPRQYLDKTATVSYGSTMPVPARTAALAAIHPIQVVTRRTGLSADVIRVWEKRYGVVTPVRSAGGRRLYSDADIERLRLLAHATLSGGTIGRLAALSPEALAALIAPADASTGAVTGIDAARPAHEAVRRPSPVPGGTAMTAARDHLDTSLAAITRFDGVALDLLLRRAAIALSAEAFLDALVVPLTERIAAHVRDGTLRPAHRHLAHAVLRRVLDHVTTTATPPLPSRDVVVTTPSGQGQELGALLAAAAAAADGWRVTYMGPGLPAEDIVETVERIGARALVLSLGAAPGDRVIPRELRRLRALLPGDVAVLLEGAGAEVHRSVTAEIRAAAPRDLAEMREQLRALADGSDDVPTSDGTAAAAAPGRGRGRR
ncbi:MerR family transcriptional regulator [Roseisolibacter sp. H3M3-2]|uniref:MerR family transcriptional regulator n=1 Tax=Roseisolibacter sp. H3M3-2 TaxID=3031323 RepID=UPI0023DC7289|nr:MerR family transcriptional regulator [Roseisolibacter sp. H3M3-2]MDF1502284.1 MerR family transcriptional regulator [Roseisolibacter sp. H3M3-2]